ncbi:MAG: rhodanese-like domain-containing protein [Actinomycetota bacterium]
MPVREVTVDDLAEAMRSGARLFDVRETDEYVGGHVPGAVHVALGTVPDHVDAFRGEGPCYVICAMGGRSMRACQYLEQFDIEVVNVAGGTRDWITGGHPVVTGESPS